MGTVRRQGLERIKIWVWILGDSVISLRSIPVFVFTAHVAIAGMERSAMTARSVSALWLFCFGKQGRIVITVCGAFLIVLRTRGVVL